MRQNSPKTDLIFDKSNTIIQCATIVFSIKGTGSIGYLEKEEKIILMPVHTLHKNNFFMDPTSQ